MFQVLGYSRNRFYVNHFRLIFGYKLGTLGTFWVQKYQINRGVFRDFVVLLTAFRFREKGLILLLTKESLTFSVFPIFCSLTLDTRCRFLISLRNVQ